MIRHAFTKSIPVMAGYIVLGIGFGLLLQVSGYGVGWALAMSIFIYAGSLQYVGIQLLAGGTSFLSIALTSLMINARHLFYGISMITPYKGAGIKKPYLIHALTDETYSIVCNEKIPDEKEAHQFYFLVSLFDQCYWVFGSVLGSVLGSLLDFDSTGIDFSMTALFVTVFVDQWRGSKEHRPALLGVLGSLLCLVLFGPERFIIPAMILIIAVLTIIRKSIEQKSQNGGEA